MTASTGSAPGLTPGEWTEIGGVSASNAELIIIAAHATTPPAGLPWDQWLAYKIITRERDPGARFEQLVIDQLAPGYGPSAGAPGHSREDAMIINTQAASAWSVEALACDKHGSGQPAICELRIRIHDHERVDDEDSS